MSALSTRLTRGAAACTASAARLTTVITSSHSPSIVVNMAVVSLGRPDSHTTRTASATAAPTLSDSPPSGVTLKATSTIHHIPSSANPPIGPPAGVRVGGGCGATVTGAVAPRASVGSLLCGVPTGCCAGGALPAAAPWSGAGGGGLLRAGDMVPPDPVGALLEPLDTAARAST